jgi:hypothetical protein
VIREERDPAFWVRVASHPQVRETLFGLDPEEIAPVISSPDVLPLASEHGGFLFGKVGSLDAIRELHTLFTPEGWGREVHSAGKAALQIVFGVCDLVTTFEVLSNPRSRPPKSFGFQPASEARSSAFGPVKTWLLTKDAWEQSPARRRM